MSTRRGNAFEQLQPGDRATLWRALLTEPELFPRIWCCDSQVFTPPAGWREMKTAGAYGDPGVALPPRENP